MLAWPLVWLQMVQQEMKQEEAAMLVLPKVETFAEKLERLDAEAAEKVND